MAVTKPATVKSDAYRSAKWDELTAGHDFGPSDVPALTLLVQWYQVVDQCIEDMSMGDGVQVAYENKMGDIRALPQIGTMKQASAEIRALNKQLGIVDGRDESDAEATQHGDGFLKVIQGRKKSRVTA